MQEFIFLNFRSECLDLVSCGNPFAQGNMAVAQNGDVFSITYNTLDGTVILTATDVIPEPGTWFGGALAFAALGLIQCRRFVHGLSRLRFLVRRLPSAI